MSNLSLMTVFGGSLSIAEHETATRELATVGSSLERVSKGVMDNVAIAGSLLRVRNEHGDHSEIYKNFLTAVSENCVGWDDKQFRANVSRAYRGYQHLPGDEQNKQFIWKLKPSLSALALIQEVPDRRLYDFVQELKKLERFPTAEIVRRFADYKTGSLAPKQKTQKSESSSSSSSSTPQSNSYTHPTSYQQPPQEYKHVPSTEDNTTFETTSETVEKEVIGNESVSEDLTPVHSRDTHASTDVECEQLAEVLLDGLEQLRGMNFHESPRFEILHRQLVYGVSILDGRRLPR